MNFFNFIYTKQMVEKCLKENKKTEETEKTFQGKEKSYKEWHKQHYNPYFDYTFNKRTNNSDIKK
tara:strand:- start:2716 stop:2910 length:195 start_codon:yes stop_codon:yes gene_type:complete